MAKELFDFKAFQALKYAEYKKQHAKTAVVKKAKAGLVFTKYNLGSKKKIAVFIPFLKWDEADKAYKALKKDKSIHLVKWTSLVKATQGKGEITLEIKKGGLTADVIVEELNELFDKTIKLKLNVTGTSEDASEIDTNTELEPETKTEPNNNTDDTLEEETELSTLGDLKSAFQEAKKIYDQVAKVDSSKKPKVILSAWNKIEELMPQLETFISSSDKDKQVEAAKKINEAAKTIQSKLQPHIDKIRAKQGEKSNSNLDTLTSGISNKAAQLLSKYKDQIESIEGLAEKLQNISQIV